MAAMDDLVAKATTFAQAVADRDQRLRDEKARSQRDIDEVRRLFKTVVIPAKDEALRNLRNHGFTADQTSTSGDRMFEVQIGISGIGRLHAEAGETLRIELRSKTSKPIEMRPDEITTDRIVGCFVELVEILHREFDSAEQA